MRLTQMAYGIAQAYGMTRDRLHAAYYFTGTSLRFAHEIDAFEYRVVHRKARTPTNKIMR
jgi:hypothetical protein